MQPIYDLYGLNDLYNFNDYKFHWACDTNR